MRALLIAVLLLLSVGLAGQAKLSEVETLKAENLKLKAQLVELQRALAQAQLDQSTRELNEQRAQLETAFRVTLQAPADAVFNWQTLTFEAPKPPAEPPQQR